MTSGQHVVIVDGVPETAEVLREVFGPRGHRVERVRSFDPASMPPTEGSVLVVHDDAASEVDRRFKYGTVPRVIIGTITTDDAVPSSGDERRLSQPFQYAELIRAVEALLDEQMPQRSAA